METESFRRHTAVKGSEVLVSQCRAVELTGNMEQHLEKKGVSVPASEAAQ